MISKVCDKIVVVLVNWNGATDTISCLSSLQRLEMTGLRLDVVIVDNASIDDSIMSIEGAILMDGYCIKSQICSSHNSERVIKETWFVADSKNIHSICLVRARINYGFAGANNIGYQIASMNSSPDFVWYLNNDTEVDPNSLKYLVMRMHSSPDIGICGAKIVFYDHPELVQVCGGVRYMPMSGRGRAFFSGMPSSQKVSNEEAEAQINYIAGASMFVRSSLIKKIGLMSEDYFLYCEEVDWAWRCRGLYRLGVETSAIVRHKEGASIGTESFNKKASVLSIFFQTRSKLIFTYKYMPWFLPTVWLTLLAKCLRYAISADQVSALIILQVLFGKSKPVPSWFNRHSNASN